MPVQCGLFLTEKMLGPGLLGQVGRSLRARAQVGYLEYSAGSAIVTDIYGCIPSKGGRATKVRMIGHMWFSIFPKKLAVT